MILLIDAGNTRIKWALQGGERSGVLPVEKAADLWCQVSGLQYITKIWASNVAGDLIAQHILDTASKLSVQIHFIAAQNTQCGVQNGYTNPAQLGCDRWAAMIAAWHLTQSACLVVSSGTATTVDALSASGEFLGGLILPGITLMQRSLYSATAQLHAAQGAYTSFPKNTADALYSGALQACCGAIDRQHALLADACAPVVLSGGAATALQNRLKLSLLVVDNLVLQGLWLISQEKK